MDWHFREDSRGRITSPVPAGKPASPRWGNLALVAGALLGGFLGLHWAAFHNLQGRLFHDSLNSSIRSPLLALLFYYGRWVVQGALLGAMGLWLLVAVVGRLLCQLRGR